MLRLWVLTGPFALVVLSGYQLNDNIRLLFLSGRDSFNADSAPEAL